MDIEKVKKIADHYGIESQLVKTVEETTELQKAVAYFYHQYAERDENISTKPLIDELADVSIMIEQLKYLLECDKEVQERIEFKLNRQIDRMKLDSDTYK